MTLQKMFHSGKHNTFMWINLTRRRLREPVGALYMAWVWLLLNIKLNITYQFVQKMGCNALCLRCRDTTGVDQSWPNPAQSILIQRHTYRRMVSIPKSRQILYSQGVEKYVLDHRHSLARSPCRRHCSQQLSFSLKSSACWLLGEILHSCLWKTVHRIDWQCSGDRQRMDKPRNQAASRSAHGQNKEARQIRPRKKRKTSTKRESSSVFRSRRVVDSRVVQECLDLIGSVIHQPCHSLMGPCQVILKYC